MNDTDPKATQRIIAMFRRKTPAERLIMGCSMFDFARQFVVSSLGQNRPPHFSGVFRQQLFLRFYGNDFGDREREEILAHLRST